jgi:hypothetical protein
MPEHRQDSSSSAPIDEPDTTDEDDAGHDVSVPFEPHEDDDTPLGDSDQHSDA